MTTSTNFTYAPQPPLIPKDQPDQRWFAGIEGRDVSSPNCDGDVVVYAFTGDDTVRVSVSMSRKYAAANLGVDLHPRELRTLARACLDAAAYLEHRNAPSSAPAAITTPQP